MEHSTNGLVDLAKRENRSSKFIGKFRCSVCKLRTKSSKTLRQHIEQHSLSEKVKHCLQYVNKIASVLIKRVLSFKPAGTLLDSNIRVEEESELRIVSCYPCTFCSRGFGSFHDLNHHLHATHKIFRNENWVVHEYFR